MTEKQAFVTNLSGEFLSGPEMDLPGAEYARLHAFLLGFGNRGRLIGEKHTTVN
jgi:hypothetical protein